MGRVCGTLQCVYHSKTLNNWISHTITALCEIMVPHLLSKSQTLMYSEILSSSGDLRWPKIPFDVFVIVAVKNTDRDVTT